MAKAQTEVKTVTMTDGRVVEFPGKRKMQKAVKIDADGFLEGTFDYLAPGADRLQLTPKLVVLDKINSDANANFLPLTEFSLGLPYKQNQQTQYNIIGDEMSRRLYETSGNFVIDPFLLGVKTARIIEFRKKNTVPLNESLADTYLDRAVYAILAYMFYMEV